MDNTLGAAIRKTAAICERLDQAFLQAQEAGLSQQTQDAAMDAALSAGSALSHLVSVYLDLVGRASTPKAAP